MSSILKNSQKNIAHQIVQNKNLHNYCKNRIKLNSKYFNFFKNYFPLYLISISNNFLIRQQTGDTY